MSTTDGSKPEQEKETTAVLLGKFRTELTQNGIPDNVADDLVRHAGTVTITEFGWSVTR
ncbi:hypothetical protein [Cellulosimicrobium sp. I38E]|uniref:hypothetical protein n=1 Tax=Cellulosimicrobium sp. I38E TaxID=1393139 RepID=UPI000A755F0C|nr:hypothetical protein [Cellulosimicrobium sp. I38E]